MRLLKVIGNGPDEIAELEELIAAERRKGAEASAELERLDEERRRAPDFESARAVDEAIARCRWQMEHADALLPELGRQLSVLKAQRQAAAAVRHHKAAERVFRKLRVAIDAAAAVQLEAIAARNAAIADLGEGGAARIPAVAYMGFLLPDLVAVWATDLERAFSGPPPKPKPVPPSPATIEKSLAHFRQRERTRENQFIVESLEEQLRQAAPERAGPRAINPALNDTSQPVPRPKREPRRDTQAGKGERLVQILRTGVDVAGYQAGLGDVLSVPIAVAEGLVRGGAAEFEKE